MLKYINRGSKVYENKGYISTDADVWYVYPCIAFLPQKEVDLPCA